MPFNLHRRGETSRNKINALTSQVLVPWKVQRVSRAWKLDVKGSRKESGEDANGFLEVLFARQGREVFGEQGIKTHKAGGLLGPNVRCG